MTRNSPGFLDKFGERGSFNNLSPGIAFKTPEEEAEIIQTIKPIARREGSAIIASIGAPARAWEEWTQMVKIVEDAGADAIQIMMCCPVPLIEGLGAFSATEGNLREILKVIRSVVNIKMHFKIVTGIWMYSWR